MTYSGNDHVYFAQASKLMKVLTICLFIGSMTANGADKPESFCQSAGPQNDFDCAKASAPKQVQTDISSRMRILNNWLEDEERVLHAPLVKTNIPESAKLREMIKSNSQLLATELKQAKKLQTEGKVNSSVHKVNNYLASNTKDPNGWLLYAIALMNHNKMDDAADIFSKLIELYPEYPEAYNNLAVIHARKGQNEKAVEILIKAFETHPSYAQIQTNLKKIYTTLATQAYNKAINLDTSANVSRANLGVLDQIYITTPSETELVSGPPMTPAKPSQLVIEERQISDGIVPLRD